MKLKQVLKLEFAPDLIISEQLIQIKDEMKRLNIR